MLMVITDAHDLSLAVHTASASPHEISLVEATVAECVTVRRIRRLIGDRAYGSDPNDDKPKAQVIELVAPHRKGRKNRLSRMTGDCVAISGNGR